MFWIYSAFNLICLIGGIYIYRKCYNPISLYSAVWEISLGTHHSGLITFYELSSRTWFVIFLAQFLFDGFAILAVYISRNRKKPVIILDEAALKKGLSRGIVFAAVIAAVSVISTLFNVIRLYGWNLLSNVTTVYAARVNDKVDVQAIPYIGSFLYVAIVLCGIYLKKYGFHFMTIPVMFLLCLEAFTSGARAGLVFGMVFFVSAYLVTDSGRKKKMVLRKVLPFLSGVLLIAFFLFLITRQRTSGQKLNFATDRFLALFGNNSLIYKIVSYIGGPIGTLNEYLKESEFHFGQNTFLFVYNFLSKLNFFPKIEQYQEWFYSPVGCNVGTWIRELIEDFTLTGSVFAFSLFGYWVSCTFVKGMTESGILNKMQWSILSLSVVLSFFDWRMRSTNIWLALIFGMGISLVIEYRAGRWKVS